MRQVTVSPIYLKSSLKGAILKGYNAEDILRAQGLSPQLIRNPKLRISTLEFAELTEAITALLRDETCGLLAKPTPIGTFKFLTQACIGSRNLQESLETWRDGGRLLDNSSASFTRFDDQGGYISFTLEKAPGIDDDYIVESLMTTCHRFHCWLLDEFLPIERVDLAYPEPDFSEEHRFVFYGAPIHYNQRQNAIHFSRQSLDLPCHRTPKDLRQLFRQAHTYIMTQPRQSKSASIRVRLWMEKLFREGGGLAQLNEAANHLGLTEQTLRRRLKADGYSFNKLKEDTRRDMAIYYIKETHESIEAIAFRLGFSEASTFIRAFKTWTGLTPLAYRKL